MKIILALLMGILIGLGVGRMTMHHSDKPADGQVSGADLEPAAQPAPPSTSEELDRLRSENARLRSAAAARMDASIPDFSALTNGSGTIALAAALQNMMRTNAYLARFQVVMKEQARIKADAWLLRLQQLGLTSDQAGRLSLLWLTNQADPSGLTEGIHLAEPDWEAGLSEVLSPEQMTNYTRLKAVQDDRRLRAQGLEEVNELQEMTGFDESLVDRVMEEIVQRDRKQAEPGDQAEDIEKNFAGQMALILSPAQFALFQRWQQAQKEMEAGVPTDQGIDGFSVRQNGSSFSVSGWTSYGPPATNPK